MCVYSSRSFSLSSSFLLSSTPIAAGCPRTFCAITDSSVHKRSLEERSTIPSIFYATLTPRCMRASSSVYNNDPLRVRLTLAFRKDRYCYFHVKNYDVSLRIRMLTELSLKTGVEIKHFRSLAYFTHASYNVFYYILIWYRLIF